MWESFFFQASIKDPYVTDLLKLNPVDFPLSQWKFSLSGNWWNFSFIRPVCGFPGPPFTYPAYNICACMFEKGKTTKWQKGATWWKICRLGDICFFFRKPGENINATGSVTEGWVKDSSCRDLFTCWWRGEIWKVLESWKRSCTTLTGMATSDERS